MHSIRSYQLRYRASILRNHCLSASYKFRAITLHPFFVLLLLLLLFSVPLFSLSVSFPQGWCWGCRAPFKLKTLLPFNFTHADTRVLRSPRSSVHLRLQPSAHLSSICPP